MKPPFLRTPYNYDTNKAGDESGLDCQDATLAQQHMKDECDINYLVARFVVPENMPRLVMPPLNQDFYEATDFQTAMNNLRAAQESFMELPATVRSRFNNDPGAFVDFCSDDANAGEVRKLGLLSQEAIDRLDELDRKSTQLAKDNAAAAAELAELKKATPKEKGVT